MYKPSFFVAPCQEKPGRFVVVATVILNPRSPEFDLVDMPGTYDTPEAAGVAAQQYNAGQVQDYPYTGSVWPDPLEALARACRESLGVFSASSIWTNFVKYFTK